MTEAQNMALYIAEQCQAAGMTLAGAAGVIANVEAESAWQSNNLEDQYNRRFGVSDATYTEQVDAGTRSFIDSAGYGLIQWTYPTRKEKMLQFHKARGKSISDFKTQVAFLLHEMRTEYPGVWNRCTKEESPYTCGYYICTDYENPANKFQQGEFRGNLAKNWYDWLKENGGQQSSVPDSSGPSGISTGTPVADNPPAGWENIPATESWPPRTVDANCYGWPEVWLLQTVMKCRGWNVVPNGIWNRDLTEYVKDFQRVSGLSTDGCVGPMTWAKLLEMDRR